MTSTLTITVVGCSGSFAGPDSPASCYLIESTVDAVTTRVVLDLGNGSLGPLQSYCNPVTDLDAILVTHLHPDHFIDLCGLYVLRKYNPHGTSDVPQVLFGPKGLFRRMQLAYYGSADVERSGEFDDRRVRDGETFEVGSLRITPVRVEHPVEAYGYRVESPAGTVAFSGDTDATPALTPLLADADLALVDAAFVEGRDEIRGIHLTARRAVQAALTAGGVGRLVLTHIPPWNDPAVTLAEAAELWPGVELARAGARYSLSS